MAKIGFARVSTLSQDLTEQVNCLKEFGCRKIFTGKHSGKAKSNQHQLNELLDYIREGDIVVVTRLDRLGRSLSQCLNVLDYFRQNKIGFVSISQHIDTTKRDDPMTMALIQLLGVFAELERSFIVQRTQEGKQAKLAAGNMKAKGGRPPKVTDVIKAKIMADFKDKLSLSQVSRKYSLSKSTVANLKREYRNLNNE